MSSREVGSSVCVCVLVTWLCLTLCDPIYYSPPDSSVHGILQARILKSIHSFLWGIFRTQGSNPSLPHCRQIFFLLSEPPKKTEGSPGRVVGNKGN